MAARGSVKAWLKGNNNVAENAKVTNNAKESKQKPGRKMANKIPGENKADLSSVFDEGKADLVQAVANILGVQDVKSVWPDTSLGDLGLNSLMGVEVKLTLERDYDIVMPMKDIRALTINKLKEIAGGAGGQSAEPTAAPLRFEKNDQQAGKKRKPNVIQGLEVQLEDSEFEEEAAVGKKKKVALNGAGGKATKGKATKGKAAAKGGRVDGLTVEQHRRALGDKVKAQISVLGGRDNYGIAARCHALLPCSMAVFRALVLPNATKVVPAEFGPETEVVLAQLTSTQQIAAIFGSTKIKGGTRYGSWSATSMDIVFLPGEGVARAWWVMAD